MTLRNYQIELRDGIYKAWQSGNVYIEKGRVQMIKPIGGMNNNDSAHFHHVVLINWALKSGTDIGKDHNEGHNLLVNVDKHGLFFEVQSLPMSKFPQWPWMERFYFRDIDRATRRVAFHQAMRIFIERCA